MIQSIANKLFWSTLIIQGMLGDEGAARQPDLIEEFSQWMVQLLKEDAERRHRVLREIEGIALDALRRLDEADAAMKAGACGMISQILQPLLSEVVEEFDSVFRRIIGYSMGAKVKFSQRLSLAGPTGESIDLTVDEEEIEREACQVLARALAGEEPKGLRYLTTTHIGFSLEREIDAPFSGSQGDRPLRIELPFELPLLPLPIVADPPLRQRLLELFRQRFEDMEPPLAHLLQELQPDLSSEDRTTSDEALRRVYRAYLRSTHFQLTRDLGLGFEHLSVLAWEELDALCGPLPPWHPEKGLQKAVELALQEAPEGPGTAPPEEFKTLSILIGPSQWAFSPAKESEKILEKIPEGRRLDVLSKWAEFVEINEDLFASLQGLAILLHLAHRSAQLKVLAQEKEISLRDWLIDHLLKVLRFRPPDRAVTQVESSRQARSLPLNAPPTLGSSASDRETLRRSIHARVLRLAFRAVASPFHLEGLRANDQDSGIRDLGRELLLRGVVLAYRILTTITRDTRLRSDHLEQKLAEIEGKLSSTWDRINLQDQLCPELYGPEADHYDHFLAGTLAVLQAVGFGGPSREGEWVAPSTVPFWLTRPVRHALMALANRPENDAERRIREARERGVPNRLKTFLDRTPHEYAAELLRFASPEHTREEEIFLKGQAKLLELLRQASDAVNVEREPLSRGPDQPDMIAKVRIKGEERLILVETKSSGEPRHLRQAIAQLQSSAKRFSASYGIIVVPFLSERSAKVCEENGVGYVDLKGNAFIKFDGIFIRTVASGKDRMQPARSRSLFAPISTRFLRVLLSEPERQWKLKDLAEESHMSLGQAYKVKEELLNQELIGVDQKKQISLKDPSGLLDAWREAYCYENSEVLSLFSLDKIPAIEERVKQYCDARKTRYALTLFSGASRLAPFVRYSVAAFYIIGDKEELKRELNLKPVDSGANILLLSPYDEGIFYGLQEVQGYKIVSAVQLYLDLYSYGGRGREQAEFIREKLIGF